MLEPFVNFIKQQHLFDYSQEVLLAISGGRDSTVMCELFCRAGFRFAIAHCNFHLRPGDCDRDEAFVKSLADRYGVPFHVAHFDAMADAKFWKTSVEDAARRERYGFFAKLCEEFHYEVVATAHHRDDSIETFFLNLVRGTGISGLRGMKVRNGNVVRPMLCFTREDIDSFVEKEHLEYVEDYTNQDEEFRRNLIRHRIVPLFRELSPSFDRIMAENLSRLADVETVYKNAVESVRSGLMREGLNGAGCSISISDIENLTPQRTMLFELIHPLGFTIDQVEKILDVMTKPAGQRFYSMGYRLTVERDILEIRTLKMDRLLNYQISVQEALSLGELRFGGITIKIGLVDLVQDLCLDSSTVLIDLMVFGTELCFRRWRDGDRFRPFGMRGSRLVSDFFKDMKMTTCQKEDSWLLCSQSDQIAWIVGWRADDRFRVTSKTTKVLKLQVVS